MTRHPEGPGSGLWMKGGALKGRIQGSGLVSLSIRTEGAGLLTAMYGRQPASRVLAMESTSWPLMPKSHSLMLPFRSRRMLDGLMSAGTRRQKGERRRDEGGGRGCSGPAGPHRGG